MGIFERPLLCLPLCVCVCVCVVGEEIGEREIIMQKYIQQGNHWFIPRIQPALGVLGIFLDDSPLLNYSYPHSNGLRAHARVVMNTDYFSVMMQIQWPTQGFYKAEAQRKGTIINWGFAICQVISLFNCCNKLINWVLLPSFYRWRKSMMFCVNWPS